MRSPMRLAAISTAAIVTCIAATAASGAPARAGVCAQQPRPSALQVELREALRFRRELGFRSDRPYVRRLQRSRPGPWVVLTGTERAYVRLRASQALAAQDVGAYLDGIDPELNGGVSVEDSPGRPYVLARVTRDPELHAAELRRRFPAPDDIEVRLVGHSQVELHRLAERVTAERDELRAAGFEVGMTGPALDSNSVRVDLVTRRDDSLAFFRARYGNAVTTRVVARDPTRLACTSPTLYRVAKSDGRTLRLEWTSGPFALARVQIRETRRRVRIGIVERVPNAVPFPLISVPHRTTATLRKLLGDRVVIGATTGVPVPLNRCAPPGRSGSRSRGGCG